MNLKALLQQAFVSLTQNWLRSVLTILGISVGVGAFICVVAIGNAGSSKIEDCKVWVTTLFGVSVVAAI